MKRGRLLVVAGLAFLGAAILIISLPRPPWRGWSRELRDRTEPSNSAPSPVSFRPPGDSGWSSATEASPAVRAESLPGPIRSLLARQEHQRPRMHEVPAFGPAVEDELIRRYRAIRGLGEKQHILRMLAYQGGEKSVALFVEALTLECKGRRLSGAEETVMLYLPQLMGVLASRHESAATFLRDGTDPVFWARHREWEWDDRPLADTSLAGAALKGLALTGSEEARELLESYRSRKDLVVRSYLAGAIVDAVYIHRRVTEHGLEKTMDEILHQAGDLGDFRAWSATDEGRDWSQWYERLKSGRTK